MFYFFRVLQVSLVCDDSKYPGETDGVSENFLPKNSAYVCIPDTKQSFVYCSFLFCVYTRILLVRCQPSILRPEKWLQNHAFSFLSSLFLEVSAVQYAGQAIHIIYSPATLCSYWLRGKAGRENVWLKVMAYGPNAARSKSQIFSHLALPIYRIFSIKRWGRLFKTRPRRPSVYLSPAFIKVKYFSSILVALFLWL